MAEVQFNLNSQEFYYHVSPIYLENGSVIKKGNWGRVLKQYIGNDCGGLNLFRERVLEEIRQKNFPTKPSRLDCIFLLVSIDEAKTYQNLQNLRTSLIYKVRITNLATAAHLGNYNKVLPTPPDCHFEKMDEVATNYWAGIGLNDVTPRVNQQTNILEQLTTIELLVQSDIQIVECLNN